MMEKYFRISVQVLIAICGSYAAYMLGFNQAPYWVAIAVLTAYQIYRGDYAKVRSANSD